MSSRFPSSLPRFLSVLLIAGTATAQDVEPIGIKTISGLRFDPPRFVVEPGAKVKVEIENVDDMAHNFVLAAPGTRLEIVNAAMTMPVTPEQTFIPPSDNVLHYTPVLPPGGKATLEFTAPATDGVYPFICTYPGHGLVMYGAMYVTKRSEASLPLIAEDENLPEIIRDQAKTQKLHAYPTEPPYWYRTFLRDTGPASFAVALPGGQNYCWDAGACRLRYVWRGAFLDPQPHWRGNGDAFAEVKGTIYFRPGAFPLRFGDARKIPTGVRFLGFNVVDQFPEFRYEVGGIEVRELIKPAHHGGLDIFYKINGGRSSMSFVIEPGAGVEPASNVGKFANGVLKIPPKTKEFLVTLVEIPNREPLGYWSMNDTLGEKKPLPVDGVKGRAVIFDGKKSQFATGLKTDVLAEGATFAVWAQLTKAPNPEQVFIGAKLENGEFALGANLAGVPGYGVRVKNGDEEARVVAAVPMEADENWHHLAATLDARGLRFYLDGKPAGLAAAAPLPKDAELFLGSSGKANFAGALLDEARIYGRVLEAKDIAALYQGEHSKVALPKPAPKATPKPASKPAATPAAKASAKPAR